MNAASSWGNSTGFGNSNSQPGPISSQANTSLFGTNQPTQQSQSSGLFGSSNTSAGTTGGLFGTSTSNATSSGSSGGLFGNSNGAKPTGGLFGASNSQTTSNPTNTASSTSGSLFGNSSSGGLFGNSNKRAVSEGPATTAPSGGLFSNTVPASGGLFGSSTTGSKPSTGGLFSSSTSQAPTTGGLFGSSTSQAPTSGGLFSSTTTQAPATATSGTNTSSGGLFGNSNKTNPTGLFGATNTAPSTAPTSGLFGNSNSSGGLFGNSNPTNPTGSLFANSSSTNAQQNQNGLQNASITSNVYGSNPILSTINTSEAMMPSSITSSLFGSAQNASLKKNKTASPSTKKFKSSLLGKLAQTFNIFRPGNNQHTNKANLKGVFTQSNYVKDIPLPATSKFRVQKPTTNGVDFSSRSLGSVNKLVVKSKPTKFHLIDADKVLKAKQTKILTSTRDDDLSETELEESPIPEPITGGKSNSAKTMEGHGVQSNDILVEDKTDDPESNDGYFCYPPLKELALLTTSQLKQVPDFIIGRIGHGQVAYNFPVDLSGTFEKFSFDTNAIAEELFGKLFIFKSPSVVVYDDQRYISPLNFSELNFPATLTMKVHPQRYGTVENLIRVLKNVEGQEFVTYDPITHNWISQVEHFSVWGLLDDDEVEGDETEELKRLKEMKKKQNERERDSFVKHSNLYENESYRNELKRQRIQRQTSEIPGGWEFDTTVKADSGSLGVKQNLVRNEINQEVNQFKTDKSAIYIATNASDITSDSEDESMNDNEDGLALDGPLFPDEVRNYDYIKELVHVAPTNAEMEEIVDEKVYEPDLDDEDAFKVFEKTSSFPTSRNWLLQLELANDVSSALAPELRRPRKAQPALNSVNDILFADLPNNHNESYQASTPMKETPEPCLLLDNASTLEKEVLSRFSKDILIKSSINTRENKFPSLKIDDSLTFKTISALLTDATDVQYLRLAAILFDKPDLKTLAKYKDLDYSNLHLVKRLECIEEKQGFAGWLKVYNKEFYKDLFLSEEPLDKIFSNVCQGELKKASALAIESSNLHLAPLLTLMDSNDATVRSIAESQLTSWEESGYSEFIPESVLKTYKLLAGDFASFVGELPTYARLALEVFYGNPAESISSLISRFSHNVELDDELGYILKINAVFKVESFAKCCEILVDSNLSLKLKWIFYQILSSGDFSGKDITTQDAVGILFGKELESCGLWKEALYVYASMASDDKVEETIRASLIKSVDHFEGDKQQQEFLEKVLRVPRELIYEAISIKKRRKEDYWGCGQALVFAGMWDEAHELICEKLAPLAIIEEATYVKSVVRSLIDSFPQKGSLIGSWSQGAGLYSKYLQVIEQADKGEVVEVSDIAYLLDNLALIQNKNNYLVNVATQIVTKRVGDLALEYQSKLTQAKEKIFNLALGENEKTYFTSRLGK